MFQRNKLSLAIATAFGAGALGFQPTAIAQDAQVDGEEDALEEVIVTGSRIKRADFVSNSPVATVGEQQFDLTGTVNTESLLNTLPQAVPGLDRTSNNPGNGTATVDLRGLGSSRTLVLINGRRATPTTGGGIVDINNIPTNLIETVEVVTGGASAVYGSDAVSGVVNFVLKDDYEGAEANVGYEITEDGDAGLFSADFTVGSNFADGRGNAVINLSYTDREDLFQGDRDFATFAQFDDVDADGNLILIDGGSSGVPATSIFSGGFSAFSPSAGIIFNQDGSVRPFQTGETNDFYNYAPVNYIQLPQERRQANVLLNYDLTDTMNVYSEFHFTSSDVPQQLAPTPIFQTSTFTLDGSPFITPDAQRIISNGIGDGVDTDGDGIDDTATALVRRRLEEVGPRISQSDFQSYTATLGLKGDFGTSDWSYDTYFQIGNTTGTETQLGNVSRQRFEQALLLNAAGTACSDPSNNGSTVGCAPLNIFGEGNISPQAAQFLRTAVTSIAEFDQTLFGFNVTGSVGNIGVAAGYEYREDQFDFRPSQALASGDIAGFNGAPASGGRFSVNELYVEALVPIIDALEVELAYRYSDYSTIGGVSTYKISPSFEINDQVRLRGGFNRAVRAPNIAELFSPPSEGFPGANDPCSGDAAPISPAVAEICAATGVPANVIGSVAINPAAGQVREVGGGNPNLEEETADTFTVGVVVSPTDNLTFSLDYFDIEIEDYIATFGGGANAILTTCYDPTDPAGGIGSDFCNVINRRPDGTIDFVSTTAENVASQTLQGVDLQIDYTTDLAGGTFGVKYLGTYTIERDFTPFDGAEPIECAGRFGQVECDDPNPDYKHRAAFSWANDKLTAQLVWRYIGSAEDDDEGTEYTVEEIGDESYFDFSGSYQFNDTYSVTFGIDNLFDNEPPILGDNQEQANTYPATYDVFGRTYFAKFNASF